MNKINQEISDNQEILNEMVRLSFQREHQSYFPPLLGHNKSMDSAPQIFAPGKITPMTYPRWHRLINFLYNLYLKIMIKYD